MSEYHDDAHGECETLPPEIDKLFELWRKFCVSDNLDGVRANVLIEIRKVEDDAPDVDFDAVVRMFAGESEVDKWRVRGGREMRQAPAPEIQRQRTRWKIWQVVALALLCAAGAAVAVGIPFLRGRGGDLKKAERPTAKAHADAVVEDAREKAKAALEADEGPPDTLEVGGEVGILENLRENCFWGVLKSGHILALAYRIAESSGGERGFQELVMIFSPDSRSCLIITSKRPPLTGGIYVSNNGGKFFAYIPSPSVLQPKSYLETHANLELREILLAPALSESLSSGHGGTIDVRHFPENFYGFSPAEVSEKIGIERGETGEHLKEEFAKRLVVACIAERRKTEAAAGRQK